MERRDLDPVIEGVQELEYSTLQALAGRKGRAAPAAMTGRLDALERRGFVRRRPSSADRRRVDVELAADGYRAWRAATLPAAGSR
jgi:DNA-binding MarR family transcriptional regulator